MIGVKPDGGRLADIGKLLSRSRHTAGKIVLTI
jgi:hypothetical protein